MIYERRDLKYGFIEFQANDTGVWITAAEANSSPELIALYKEIRNLLNEEFPNHTVQFFIDPSQPKLVEAFLNHSEFEVEYISFKWNRPQALFEHEHEGVE